MQSQVHKPHHATNLLWANGKIATDAKVTHVIPRRPDGLGGEPEILTRGPAAMDSGLLVRSPESPGMAGQAGVWGRNLGSTASGARAEQSPRPRARSPFSQCRAQRETVGHTLRKGDSPNAVAEGQIKPVGVDTCDFPSSIRFAEQLGRV